MGAHALLVGVSQFKDRALARLSAPETDVRRLASILGDPKRGAFDQVEMSLNEKFDSVHDKVVRLFEQRNPKDTVLFYYSGHGIVAIGNRLFLTTKETDPNLPRARSVAASELRELMETSRAGRLILILDCCHSGAFVARAKRGKPAVPVTDQTFAAGDGAEGHYVLMATNELQYALDANVSSAKATARSPLLSRSTSWLVEGLEKGAAAPDRPQITVDDLFQDVCRRARKAGAGMTPERFVSWNSGEMVIASNPLFKQDLASAESMILQATNAIKARFELTEAVTATELQKLAFPLKRRARGLNNFTIIDRLLSRPGDKSDRSAAVFAAAVILYERMPQQYFSVILSAVTGRGSLRAEAAWWALCTVRRYLGEASLSERQRQSLTLGLRRYAQVYDETSGSRFDIGRVLGLVYEIAKHKKLKLLNDLSPVFSAEQLAALLATRKRELARDHPLPNATLVQLVVNHLGEWPYKQLRRICRGTITEYVMTETFEKELRILLDGELIKVPCGVSSIPPSGPDLRLFVTPTELGQQIVEAKEKGSARVSRPPKQLPPTGTT